MFELKIKVKRLNPDIPLPKVIKKGDWVDLFSAETVKFAAPRVIKGKIVEFDCKRIALGVAMKLPDGCTGYILPRSSTPDTYGIEMRNSQAVMDNSYSGNKDEWRFSARAVRETTIYGPHYAEDGSFQPGSKICQFCIQLNQKATIWQKLRWLFSNGIKIVEVDDLDSEDRGGFGTTGK